MMSRRSAFYCFGAFLFQPKTRQDLTEESFELAMSILPIIPKTERIRALVQSGFVNLKHLEKMAKERVMVGKWNWVIAIALMCAGASLAHAQTPPPEDATQKPALDSPTLPMPSPVANSSEVPMTNFSDLPIQPTIYADAD